LDTDNESNLIWQATYGELSKLLIHSETWDEVEFLIGFHKDVFVHKLDELRSIRNVLAHNRALSQTTEDIVHGIIASFKLSIRKFKTRVIYAESDILPDRGFNQIGEYFNEKIKNNDWSKYQAFISANDNFYSLVCLPVERHDDTPSAAKILKEYCAVQSSILAFLFNKCGSEYIILIPRSVSEAEIKTAIDIFLENPDVWTHKQFTEQHPKYICNPRIWFYENRIPFEE
jgi:hypothetical protein